MRVQPEACCAQCGLPIRGGRSHDAPAFCCYGCALVFRVTGEAAEGSPQGLYIRLGLGIFFAMNVMTFSLPAYAPLFYPSTQSGHASLLRILQLLLTAPVFLCLGLPLLAQAARDLRGGRISADALIAAGTLAALVVSVAHTLRGDGPVYYDTATMLLVLVTLGRYLEARARAGTFGALKALLDRTEKTCLVLREGREERVPVQAVRVGDLVRVAPGDRTPVDGLVVEGEGGLDTSAITGESRPVHRRTGDPVVSGSLSLDGSLLLRATAVGQDTTFARLVDLLEGARASRMPVQKLVDRVSAVFTPVVILIAAASFALHLPRVGAGPASLIALSVLVIACPCALGIATPLAVWSAFGLAARRGVLIRSGEAVERLARVRRAFFDKTGTLTTGAFRVTGVSVAGPGLEGDEILLRAAAVSSRSSHPIGRALRRHVAEETPVTGLRLLPGLGAFGRIGHGPETFVGSRRLMERMGQRLGEGLDRERRQREETGETTVCVAWEGEVRGLIGLSEALRSEAAEALAALRGAGVSVTVLTGDAEPAGRAVGEALGAEVRAELLPEEKVEAVRAGRKEGLVAMVGDGINDAPALSAADVGVALGCGTDLAREAADVNVIGDDLRAVPWVLDLARRTRGIICGNLFWAFFYNVAGIGLAAAGKLNPILAAGAMILSSLFVVYNSHRLTADISR
ncbi:cation-translocating P-type ATPase [bacterium]|nr:cation-translocating P-type ATPase [bacterium]